MTPKQAIASIPAMIDYLRFIAERALTPERDEEIRNWDQNWVRYQRAVAVLLMRRADELEEAYAASFAAVGRDLDAERRAGA